MGTGQGRIGATARGAITAASHSATSNIYTLVAERVRRLGGEYVNRISHGCRWSFRRSVSFNAAMLRVDINVFGFAFDDV